MEPDDPVPITETLASLEMATRRMLVTAALLTDARAREPSRLPGWTRGHVLTHLARNADGFRNLLAWARTGTETPMYPSMAARDAAIEAGAGRGAAELAADVRDSAARLAADAARLPPAAWTAMVARRGRSFPARQILAMRRSEVEFHHVDLGAGYQPGDWPADFVLAGLARLAGDLAGRPDVPALLISPDGAAPFQVGPFQVGPGAGDPGTGAVAGGPGNVPADGRAGPPGVPGVSGPPAALLAWLAGRGDGAGLRVTRGGALPVLPPWG